MRGKYCNLRASIVYRNRRVNRYCIHIILRPFSTRFSVRCHQVACIIVSTFHRNRNLCHRLRTADNCLNRRLKPHDSIFIAHIVAIFDAANRIENPTIATAFFQELSQAFPIRVSLDSDSTVSTCEAFYEKSYTVHSLENAKVSKLSNERSEMNSDFLFDSFSESSDVETKQLSLNTPTDIILFNPTEETMSYHLFAFVNNTPVMWDSSPYSSITLPAKSQFSSSILLSDSQMQNISDDSPDLFFLVAVPIHEAAQQQGTLVLKTKTIAFVT